MKDQENELLWKFYDQQMNQASFYHNQRGIVQGYILTVSIGLITLIGFDKRIDKQDLIPSFLLILLGIFGAIFNAKNHERFNFHYERARQFRKHLNDLNPTLGIQDKLNLADNNTKQLFPLLHDKIRLNKLWLILSILITLIGMILTGVILLS